jgi:hypothetical protein
VTQEINTNYHQARDVLKLKNAAFTVHADFGRKGVATPVFTFQTVQVLPRKNPYLCAKIGEIIVKSV